jgi:hypothetical protein
MITRSETFITTPPSPGAGWPHLNSRVLEQYQTEWRPGSYLPAKPKAPFTARHGTGTSETIGPASSPARSPSPPLARQALGEEQGCSAECLVRLVERSDEDLEHVRAAGAGELPCP